MPRFGRFKNGIAGRQATSVQEKSINYDRPPSFSDNASRGYVAGNLWQHNGAIYKPAAAPDSAMAAWVQQQFRGALPGDVLGTAAKCVGGLIALKQGFTGPAITLTATVAGAAVATDINILAGGFLDDDAVRRVFQSADQGTFIYVTKVFDQSGSGNHLTLVTGANVARGFYLIWSTVTNYWMLATDENYSASLGQALSFPGTLSLSESALSAFFFGEGVGSWYGGNDAVIASFGSGTNAFSIHVSEGAPGPSVAGWAGSSRRGAGGNIAPLQTGPCVVYANGAAASITYGVNEESYSFGASNATARAGGFLGSWDLSGAARFSPMRFIGFALGNATATSAQIESIKSWFYTAFNVLPQIKDRLVFISDSRGSIVNTTNCPTTGQFGENVAQQIKRRLNSDLVVINCSKSGATVNTESNNVLSNVVPGLVASYRPGVKNIAVIVLGVNEFLKVAADPATAASNIASAVTPLKAAGWTVLIVNEYSTTSSSNSASQYVQALRTLIVSGATGADQVIDVSDLSVVNNPNNTTFWPDGLHPSSATASVVGDRITDVVHKLLAKS